MKMMIVMMIDYDEDDDDEDDYDEDDDCGKWIDGSWHLAAWSELQLPLFV